MKSKKTEVPPIKDKIKENQMRSLCMSNNSLLSAPDQRSDTELQLMELGGSDTGLDKHKLKQFKKI